MTPIEQLAKELSRLPGIGEKTASRLSLFILRQPKSFGCGLAKAISDLVEKSGFCSICANVTVSDPCGICSDPGRDRSSICVVEGIADLTAIERTGAYRGLYHVLHGRLAPLDGVGPKDIRLESLEKRVASGSIRELIIATNPTAEGEATATYIAQVLRPSGVRISRIGFGIPIGAEVEYSDRISLQKSIEARKEI